MNYLKTEFEELTNQFEDVNSRIDSVKEFLKESEAALKELGSMESTFSRDSYKKQIDLENETVELNHRLSELESEREAMVAQGSLDAKLLLNQRLREVSRQYANENEFGDHSDIDKILNELVTIVMNKKKKEADLKAILADELSQFKSFMTPEDYNIFNHQQAITDYYYGDIHALRSMEKVRFV